MIGPHDVERLPRCRLGAASLDLRQVLDRRHLILPQGFIRHVGHGNRFHDGVPVAQQESTALFRTLAPSMRDDGVQNRASNPHMPSVGRSVVISRAAPLDRFK